MELEVLALNAKLSMVHAQSDWTVFVLLVPNPTDSRF